MDGLHSLVAKLSRLEPGTRGHGMESFHRSVSQKYLHPRNTFLDSSSFIFCLVRPSITFDHLRLAVLLQVLPSVEVITGGIAPFPPFGVVNSGREVDDAKDHFTIVIGNTLPSLQAGHVPSHPLTLSPCQTMCLPTPL